MARGENHSSDHAQPRARRSFPHRLRVKTQALATQLNRTPLPDGKDHVEQRAEQLLRRHNSFFEQDLAHHLTDLAQGQSNDLVWVFGEDHDQTSARCLHYNPDAQQWSEGAFTDFAANRGMLACSDCGEYAPHLFVVGSDQRGYCPACASGREALLDRLTSSGVIDEF